MKLISKNAIAVIVAQVLLSCVAIAGERVDPDPQFEAVGETRIKLVAEKIKSVECIFNEQSILMAKDGQAVTFKHKNDPRGDITVTFNHLVLPAGNWVLFGAKNSIHGNECEEIPEASPVYMEAVSAVITGVGMNLVPRHLDWGEVHSTIRVNILRRWDSTWRSGINGFDYEVSKKSYPATKVFNEGQLPLVNILHLDEKGVLMAGALYWFENKGEQPGAGQPATRPVVEPEGGVKPQPEAEGRSP